MKAINPFWTAEGDIHLQKKIKTSDEDVKYFSEAALGNNNIVTDIVIEGEKIYKLFSPGYDIGFIQKLMYLYHMYKNKRIINLTLPVITEKQSYSLQLNYMNDMRVGFTLRKNFEVKDNIKLESQRVEGLIKSNGDISGIKLYTREKILMFYIMIR